jgi:superfamily II DNA or RNA helicase
MHTSWDRGTILLHDVDTPPAGAVWDPRVDLYRAPAIAWSALPSKDDRVRPELPVPTTFPAPDLRPYQGAALGAWEVADRRGTIVLPTGAGKTRTAVAAIARAGVRTLCLAPTRVLLEPWAAALRGAGVPSVGRFGDGDRVEAPITVATFVSARAHAETLGNRFDLLVVDEAHHFGGGALDETLEMYIARWRLGLTATPPADPGRCDRLASLIGPVVFRTSLEELAGRWLAPFRTITVTVSLTATERAVYDAEAAVWRPAIKAFFAVFPSAQWASFIAHAQGTEEGRRALAAWRRSRAVLALPENKRRLLCDILDRHRESRVLVFCAEAATALRIAREFLVPALTAEIGRTERAAVLGAFAKGELRVVVSARVLNEGVDVPEADVAVLLGGNQGDREYVQRVGRVLRPSPGKEAIIYEIVTAGTREVGRAESRRQESR